MEDHNVSQSQPVLASNSQGYSAPSAAELDALEKVAREASPGPWQNGIDDLEGVVAPYATGLGNVICVPPTRRMYASVENWPENARHIATFDPPTILRLIAALRASAAQ